MSVISFAIGDLFRVTIVKYLAANPERKWGNNYEIRSKVAGVTSDLTASSLKLMAFERAIHHDLVRFDRIRMSTWEPDSVPYDPESFVSFPLALAGLRPSAGSEALALNVCLDVRRVPISGRFGHVFYRGILRELDVQAPAGKFVLASSTEWSNNVTDSLTSSDADGLLNGSEVAFEMVMINKTGTNVRQLASFSPHGVAVVPFDHAWFNRTPAP